MIIKMLNNLITYLVHIFSYIYHHMYMIKYVLSYIYIIKYINYHIYTLSTMYIMISIYMKILYFSGDLSDPPLPCGAGW